MLISALPSLTSPSDEENSKRRKLSNQDESYHPLPLHRLTSGMENVGVYALLLTFGSWKKSAKGDWMCSLSVTDRSIHPNSFNINLFRKPGFETPAFQRGDIIRFHRLETQEYGGNVRGLISSQRGSFIGFRCFSLDSTPDYQSSNNFSTPDMEIVKSLRELAANTLGIIQINQEKTESNSKQSSSSVFESSSSLDNSSFGLTSQELKYFRRLCDIRARKEFLDLYIMIIAVDQNKELLFVWDGSELAGASVTPPVRPQLPLLPNHSPLPHNPAQFSPSFGSILPLFAPSLLSKAECGHWFKLRNLSSEIDRSHQIYIQVTSKSKIERLDMRRAPIPSLLAAIQAKEKEEKEKVELSAYRTAPLDRCRTINAHGTTYPYFSPLKSILAFILPCRQFRVRSRALAFYPDRIEDFTKRRCGKCKKLSATEFHERPCKNCQAEDGLTYEWCFAILLEDGSAFLPALVMGPEADQFLLGLPADNLYHSQNTLNILRKYLLPLVEPGAWLDLTIRSFEIPETAKSFIQEQSDSQHHIEEIDEQVRRQAALMKSGMNSAEIVDTLATDGPGFGMEFNSFPRSKNPIRTSLEQIQYQIVDSWIAL